MHIYSDADSYLGNPIDVKRWAQQTGQTQAHVHLTEYDHVKMLTVKSAAHAGEHFEQVGDFIAHYART